MLRSFLSLTTITVFAFCCRVSSDKVNLLLNSVHEISRLRISHSRGMSVPTVWGFSHCSVFSLLSTC